MKRAAYYSTGIVLLAWVSLAAGATIYVDDDAIGANTGLNWADAYRYVQDGLAAALRGDEIHVAQGVYKPDQGTGRTPGDRTIGFYLKSGVTIKGGYAGSGAADPDARDIKQYETTLSGDLMANDVGDVSDPSRSENSYSVVRAGDVDETAVLDGFTITGGNANGDPAYTHDAGAGLFCMNASPTIIDCTFNDNRAMGSGGGIGAGGGGPTLTRCTFTGNRAGYMGGGAFLGWGTGTLENCVFTNNSSQHGAGLANIAFDATVTDCTFSGNSATGDGGGMRNDNNSCGVTNCTFSHNSCGSNGAGMFNLVSNSTVADCIFDDNHAGFFGGGVINQSSSSILTNCLFRQNSSYSGGAMANGGWGGPSSNTLLTNCVFAGNAADAWGGGMLNGSGSDATITNCTFSGNSSALHGAGVCNQGGSIVTTIANCILWGNNPSAVAGNTLIIHHSDVEGGTGQPWFGVGCVDVDPLFADSAGRLVPGSPCIDAGDNAAVPPGVTTDLDGNPRIAGGVVDMGAYESAYVPANTPPVVEAISGPLEPVQVNTLVTAGASFSDPDGGDNHTAQWDWGDGPSAAGLVDEDAKTVSGSHGYSAAGVYTLTLTIADAAGDSDSGVFEFVVVYDPAAGFVTGGGWIDSPAGAYAENPDLTGKATFGFVSKYQKGATVPTGNTEFQFKAGSLNFHSTSYDWLVVTASDYARFKGTGTINGSGNYKFQIWAGDKAPDTFRIKIWKEGTDGTEDVVYDNGFDQRIGGGSIVIHTM